MQRILINWNYDRVDLTDYLLELADEFEVVFIYKHRRPKVAEENTWNREKIKLVYWAEFTSPYKLLRCISPNVVVFADLEAFNQIGLNVAARNLGIPSYVLQHGMRGDYEVVDAVAHQAPQSILLSNTSSWSLKFFINSFRVKNIFSLFSIIKFVIDRKRFELTVALERNKKEWRRADYYIELSKDNTGYHKVRDGVAEDRFIIIGNPQYDKYFKLLNSDSGSAKPPYALLIDAPFCETVLFGRTPMAINEKNRYISQINKWCIDNDLKLFVKLHPLTYAVSYLINHDNIVYYRDEPLVDLIKRATLTVFVHFSSLAPLIMFYKPFIYLTNSQLPSVEFMAGNKVPIIKLDSFTAQTEITISQPLTIEQLRSQLFECDGNALIRLRGILRNPASFKAS